MCPELERALKLENPRTGVTSVCMYVSICGCDNYGLAIRIYHIHTHRQAQYNLWCLVCMLIVYDKRKLLP